MPTTTLELAQMHITALYVHDARGRLLRVNEPDPEAEAPRFILVRTTAGTLWRTRHDLPADLVAVLGRLAGDDPVAADLRESPRHAAAYSAALERHGLPGEPYEGPAFYVPELEVPRDVALITPANASLLQAHFPYTLKMLADRAPVVVVVADGVAVAACYSSRLTAQVAEAGVHTVEAYRGRGCAAETVRGWAAAVRATGRLPLYSTWWANAASRAVAAKLGAVQYAADFSIG